MLSDRLGVNISTAHPSSRVARALAKAGVAKTSELLRIVGLPRRVFDESSYPDASHLYARGPCGKLGCQYCVTGKPGLRAIQSAMIIEAAQNSGGFFNVGVGKGKTLASFLIHSALNVRKTVLLVPAQLKSKTLNSDLPEYAEHFILPPIYDSKDYTGQDGVFVVAYEELSDTDSTDLLDKIQPDLIVADEAHKLRNPGAARTKRFLRFVRHHACHFVAMTGSAMSKEILDFAHLIELALRKNSPVPRDYPSLAQWSDCIDKGRTEIGALVLLCQDDTEDVRHAFQRRFRETAGVICTTEISISTPIELRLFKLKPPSEVQQALDKLSSNWAWDGEEYDQTLEILRVERQLAQGFFYRLRWPNGSPDCMWLERRNAWRRAIRKRLGHSNRVGQDSPALLEAMAQRGEWTPQEWWEWQEVADRPEPDHEAIELSRWLVDHVVAWGASSTMPGIIWVDSPVVGWWLAELGIPFFGEGEDDAVNALAKQALEQANVGNWSVIPTIALSWRAHGTGKNLQAWSRNLVIYPPATNDAWEQMIGRTHRPGQLAPVVELDVILACTSAETAMINALQYARSVEDTMGQPQRLNTVQICEPDQRLSL